ncbi:Zinc finger BED domain-containing protein 4 [Toxocara canis]|uniref:Zinc finger BED domain-containing protein 4 n=1 Tax=Toxocara canis TaxID=6265 RepID=A0A0B2UYT7_TOXCA|nr:Zinc finger BED domain-containing protein 4 [Toxocara canis]
MGGSTMKTAKVWRYFDQLPSEEQAAECRICSKKIKATNSSTTGMIRHLRSCHANEYQLLQEARQSGLVHKQDDKTHSTSAKQFSDTQKQKTKEASAHTIANLIGTSTQASSKPAVATSSADGKSRSEAPVSKRLKIEDCSAVDLRTERSAQRKDTSKKVQSAGYTDKGQWMKENSFWPEDHPDAKRITNQVGLMLLLDNESPAAVDRAGFRGLLRLLEPKYRMPSAEKFQKVIIPEIFNQLKADIVGFQQSFLQNNPFGVEAAASGDVRGASTAQITKWSAQEHIKAVTLHPEQCELDRVVINSIRSAQNISQSFSHSIQLCDDDSDSSADAESALPLRIDSFLERIGKYVFPQAEVVELLNRCHAVVRHLEENPDDALLLGGVVNAVRSTDLRRCVEFVAQNLAAIHALHAHRPLIAFKPFSSEEAQFLADLNAHIRSTS